MECDPDWLTRLLDEKAELLEKIRKIDKADLPSFGPEQAALLTAQAGIMRAYAQILQNRVDSYHREQAKSARLKAS